MELDIHELTIKFCEHAANCRSIRFICSTPAAFESWFRAELVPALMDMGIPEYRVSPDFTYPDSRSKADLCVSTPRGKIVFELKCFVQGADRHKLESFPGQLDRLCSLAGPHDVCQVIAFATFYRYREAKLKGMRDRLFTPSRWQLVGPTQILPNAPLKFIVASAPISRGNEV